MNNLGAASIAEAIKELNVEVNSNPYLDAPGIDLSIPWDPDAENDISEAFVFSPRELETGDIIFTYVYQEGNNRNLDHNERPFLITYIKSDKAYGFQLTSQKPNSLLDYLVPISDYVECGLKKPSSIVTNMVRGVYYDRIKRKIGHISQDVKTDLINKLNEIRYDEDGKYLGSPISEKIVPTIEIVDRIIPA